MLPWLVVLSVCYFHVLRVLSKGSNRWTQTAKQQKIFLRTTEMCCRVQQARLEGSAEEPKSFFTAPCYQCKRKNWFLSARWEFLLWLIGLGHISLCSHSHVPQDTIDFSHIQDQSWAGTKWYSILTSYCVETLQPIATLVGGYLAYTPKSQSFREGSKGTTPAGTEAKTTEKECLLAVSQVQAYLLFLFIPHPLAQRQYCWARLSYMR